MPFLRTEWNKLNPIFVTSYITMLLKGKAKFDMTFGKLYL